MRKDLYRSKLNDRPATGYKRVWLEDSANRLTRNGFTAGTMLVARRRAGPGLDLLPRAIGDYTVSHRHRLPILSLENPLVAEAFPVDEIVVRMSVGLISLVPSIRMFSVRASTAEVWTVEGGAVRTPREVVRFGALPALPSGRPGMVEAFLDEANLIAGTELIANVKPAEIRLHADGLVALTATQFLKGCGWTEAAPGVLRR
jgi:hypothetical protein